MKIAVMLCQTKGYVHWVVQEIGFVLHKRLIATKALRLKENKRLNFKRAQRKSFFQGEGKEASL